MRILKKNDTATFWVVSATLIGFFVLSARFLMHEGKFHTGLLYIAVPYVLSLALYYLTPYKPAQTWGRRFWNNFRSCLIIILASSIFLMEGYVCLIMALPLFLIVVVLAFITAYIWNCFGNRSPKSYVLPIIIFLASLEGTTPDLTFNRYNEVSYSQVVNIDVDTLRDKLQKPIEFNGKRHWILSVFPMPTYVGTAQLNEGEVRKYDFVYHRWFVTNTKVGSLNVVFKDVDRNRIKTTIKDSSYISGYMKLHGTEFSFEAVGENQTKVTLSVSFDRNLDPLWYYQPLERFAVKKGVEYFINEVLTVPPEGNL
tara:strand:+ start:310971 stop:311906 length:936 start_codon:yes stop_codon:yes gene_type:complete